MSSNQVRIRFGVRVPIFVNAGIFVFYLSPTSAEQFLTAVDSARAYLPANVAGRLVCETSGLDLATRQPPVVAGPPPLDFDLKGKPPLGL